MSKYFSLIIVTLLFLLSVQLSVQAQENVDPVDAQLWLDVSLHNEYSSKVDFYGIGGYRHIFRDDLPWDRYFVNPAVKYSPLKWLGLRAGLGLFYTSYSSVSNTFEIRPWQGLNFSWPKLPRFQFSHYFRVEQRYIYNLDREGRSYDLRFRYKLSSRIQPNIKKRAKYFYLPAYLEWFADNSSDKDTQELFADELRIGVGLGYMLNKNWSWQAVAIFQRSRVEAGESNVSGIILRLTVKHELVPFKDVQRVEN